MIIPIFNSNSKKKKKVSQSIPLLCNQLPFWATDDTRETGRQGGILPWLAWLPSLYPSLVQAVVQLGAGPWALVGASPNKLPALLCPVYLPGSSRALTSTRQTNMPRPLTRDRRRVGGRAPGGGTLFWLSFGFGGGA